MARPEDEQHQPAGEALLGVGAFVGALVELMHDLAPAHERAGENLREESDVEPVADEVVARRPPGPQIRQVHHVMEGEERDAERQGDVECRHRGAGDEVGEAGEEVEILEDGQHEEVGRDGERDQALLPASSRRLRRRASSRGSRPRGGERTASPSSRRKRTDRARRSGSRRDGRKRLASQWARSAAGRNASRKAKELKSIGLDGESRPCGRPPRWRQPRVLPSLASSTCARSSICATTSSRPESPLSDRWPTS